MLIVAIRIKICLVPFVILLSLVTTETGKYTVTSIIFLELVKDNIYKIAPRPKIEVRRILKRIKTLYQQVHCMVLGQNTLFFVESELPIMLLMNTH